jgi:hypothetical protein
MDMTDNDWTSAESLATVAAEELAITLEGLGINHLGCYVASDGDVSVAFADIRDAETMVSLGVPSDHTAGTLYDRASASCLTLSELGAAGDPSDDDVRAALDAGWSWTIHPYMLGRRMDWHVSVDMSVADAYQVTGNLNQIRRVNQ